MSSGSEGIRAGRRSRSSEVYGNASARCALLALLFAGPATAQEHDYDGVEGFFQNQPSQALWTIAAMGTNAIAFNHVMYVGRSYNILTRIDDRTLGCTRGTSLANGCYHWFTATASMIHDNQMHLAQ
jgi:hypothetical protein